MLIGIHGHAGVGKDTLAKSLENNFDCVKLAFAGKLKEACDVLFGIRHWYYEEYPSFKNLPLDFWGKSPREIWQLFGTEAMRKTFGDDIWLKIMEVELRQYPNKNIVISDCRFKNEVEFILEKGGYIIHLTRNGFSGKVGVPEHESEREFILPKGKNIITIDNSGTIEELEAKVKLLVPSILKFKVS